MIEYNPQTPNEELLAIVDNIWHEGWQTARCQDEPTPEDDAELKRRYVAELEAWHHRESAKEREAGESEGALAELRWLKVYSKAHRFSPEGLGAVLDYQIRGYEDRLAAIKAQLSNKPEEKV